MKEAELVEKLTGAHANMRGRLKELGEKERKLFVENNELIEDMERKQEEAEDYAIEERDNYAALALWAIKAGADPAEVLCEINDKAADAVKNAFHGIDVRKLK